MHPLKTIIPLALVCATLLGYQYLGASWSEPTSLPPGNNVEAPLHTGPATQQKNGTLGVDALGVFGDALVTGTTSSARYCDENGENCFTAASGTLSVCPVGDELQATNNGWVCV